MRLYLTGLTFSLLAATACGVDADEAAEPARVEIQAAREGTSPPSSALLADLWTSIDYLPWEYAPDACFARSYYVAMEVASRGVPVSQEVVNLRWTTSRDDLFDPIDATKPGSPRVTYRGREIRWEYHIAALLLPPVVAEPTIIDKAMEPSPVSRDTWIAHVNTGGQPKSVPEADGNMSPGFNQFSTRGSTYVGVEPSLLQSWSSVTSPDMQSLRQFKAAQVKLACSTIMKVYDCLGQATPDPRRAQLVDRTNELASELESRGLLADWDGMSIACEPTDTFSCARD